MSKHYKFVLFVRFTGYLIFIIGIFGLVGILGPLAQVEGVYRFDQAFHIKHVIPNIITSSGQNSTNTNSSTSGPASFGGLSASSEVITPISTDFGIVIEKINANARVIPNVDPTNEKDYTQALAKGVAHAAGTSLPGQKGNIYLFSHSTDAPWNIIRFNAIFYLLRELESGDKVVMFYNNKRYDYIVFDKHIVDPNDVSYLTNQYNESILTLQTCDPPGTLFKRLIVRAKLLGTSH